MTSCGSNHHPPELHRRATVAAPGATGVAHDAANFPHGTKPAFAQTGEIRQQSHRRPEIMGQNAARDHEGQCRVDFPIRPGDQGKAVRSWKSPVPKIFQADNEPSRTRIVVSGDSSPIYRSERRRIVALIRRETVENLGLGAPRDSCERCDDLLTLGVDNPERGGL